MPRIDVGEWGMGEPSFVHPIIYSSWQRCSGGYCSSFRRGLFAVCRQHSCAFVPFLMMAVPHFFHYFSFVLAVLFPRLFNKTGISRRTKNKGAFPWTYVQEVAGAATPPPPVSRACSGSCVRALVYVRVHTSVHSRRVYMHIAVPTTSYVTVPRCLMKN